MTWHLISTTKLLSMRTSNVAISWAIFSTRLYILVIYDIKISWPGQMFILFLEKMVDFWFFLHIKLKSLSLISKLQCFLVIPIMACGINYRFSFKCCIMLHFLLFTIFVTWRKWWAFKGETLVNSQNWLRKV